MTPPSDRAVVATAAAALVGARLGPPDAAAAAAVLVTAAVMAIRRPAGACLCVAIVAGLLAERSWDGVRAAPTGGRFDGRVRFVNDPRWVRGEVRAEVRLDDGRRVQVVAREGARSVVAAALAGETALVRGRFAPLPARSRSTLARRHIGSRLAVDDVADLRGGSFVTRFANELRRTLLRGASSLPVDRRALFTGIVLGDDRDQSATGVDDFRASGLTHLLAVSGQNVVFVLVVVRPLLQRLRLRLRFVAGCGVLVGFGVLTRWEPSVLRAVAMAVLALLASVLGRPVSPVRLLALAVVALVLVDPMLAGSIGFLLSVGACAGIATVAPRLTARGWPESLAVTVAAQVGVAPVLLSVFGGIPSASIPANLLATPAAGPVMVWGLVAGLPAGLVGGRVAEWLHLPTHLLLAWIAGVARVAARWPLPEIRGVLGVVGVVGAAGALAVVVLAGRPRRRWGVGLTVAAALAMVSTSSGIPARPNEERGRVIAHGLELWRSGGAVVVVASGVVDERAILAALRRERLRRIDVLVLRSGGSAAARTAAAARHRASVRVLLAPAGHRVPGATAARRGDRVRAGPLEVTVVAGRPRLDVGVASARDAGSTRHPRPGVSVAGSPPV